MRRLQAMRCPAIVTAAIVTLVGCHGGPAYKQPPAGSFTTSTAQVQIGGTSTGVQAARIRQDFFPACGVQPLIGRLFLDGDYAASATRVVVLSHALWAARFDSSPAVIGREIELDGYPAVIVGILPTGFSVPENTQLWMPK